MTRLEFYSDCVSWPRGRLAALSYLVDEGTEIGRPWFLRNADPFALPELGELLDPRYWGVGYYRLARVPAFWFVHSCIEYVFAEAATVDAIQAVALAS